MGIWIMPVCPNCCQECQRTLAKTEEKLPNKAPILLSSNYPAEIDVSPELGEIEAAYYYSLIRVLRWVVELGRVDMDVEVSMMSSHLALPHEGHLKRSITSSLT